VTSITRSYSNVLLIRFRWGRPKIGHVGSLRGPIFGEVPVLPTLFVGRGVLASSRPCQEGRWLGTETCHLCAKLDTHAVEAIKSLHSGGLFTLPAFVYITDSQLSVSVWKYSFWWGVSYLFHLARKWLTPPRTPYYYISSLIQKRFSSYIGKVDC
jgi:hypothetical protein